MSFNIYFTKVILNENKNQFSQHQIEVIKYLKNIDSIKGIQIHQHYIVLMSYIFFHKKLCIS